MSWQSRYVSYSHSVSCKIQSEQLPHSTCVEAVGAGFDGVGPLLVLGASHHDVPGEETHLSSALEHRAVGQRDAHPEVRVLEWFGQGQSLTVSRHRGDRPHLVLSLTVPANRNKRSLPAAP